MRSVCALLVLLFAVGCGESNSGGNDAAPSPPASGRIGPAGGQLASADGGLRLEIPEGALADEVELSIEQLTSAAPHGVGNAYRLAPEGQTFLAPVQLTFAFASELTSPGGLGVAFRSQAEDWRVLRSREVDPASRTVTVSTTHFSEWALIEMLKLEASAERVATSRTVELQVLFCFEPDGDGPAALRPLCLSSVADPSDLGAWAVNGVPGGATSTGTVTGEGTQATFAAPATIPGANPVAVSVDVRSGGKPAGKLVANIEVIEGCPLGVCALAGTTTSVSVSDDGPNGEFVTTDVADLRFDYDRTDGTLAFYRASGSVEVAWTDEACTIDLAPSAFEIAPDGGELVVELHRAEPVFRGSGSSVSTRVLQTWTCPPGDPDQFTVEDDHGGGTWAVGESTLLGGVLEGREEREAGGYVEWRFEVVP